MYNSSSSRRRAQSLLTFLVLLSGATGVLADSYTTSPPTLTIPSLAVGNATFSGVVIAGVGVADVIPPRPVLGGTPNGNVDSYDAASRTLFIPSVTVNANPTPYANVSVSLAAVTPSQVTFGSVTGADSFGGGALTIPVLEITNGPLGGRTFCNVVIPAADINLGSLSVSMGLPHGAEDVYDWTTALLTVPAVSVTASGKVYTNVTATLTSYAHVSYGSCGASSGLASASGSVTGAWIQGVTVAISGGTTATTTTDANGRFSFTNLPPGQSYTFTPALAGYSYSPAAQTVAVPVRSAAPVAVPAIVASSQNPSNTISGTVSYAGSATGPVYLLVYNAQNSCSGCSANGGTLVRLAGGSAGYTIRGLQQGSYYVSAFLDALGTGVLNLAADPAGSTATINIGSSGVTAGVNLVLSDPAVAIPPVPSIAVAQPGNSSAFVLYNPSDDNNGNELASSYTLSWGTDTGASNGGTKNFVAQGNNGTVTFIPNLTDGSVLYFKLRATSPAGNSAYSAITGPVTIGAPTGANTVSGTVTFNGTATGPMLVIVHTPQGNGGVYYTVVGSPASPPVSGAAYQINGVPGGDYQLAVIVDNNNNGLVDAGDFTYGFGGNSGSFAVNGTTTENVTLSTANVTSVVQTGYFYSTGGSGYSLSAGVRAISKQVVSATLFSGPNIAVPLDLAYDPNNGDQYISLANSSIAPVVGQSYGFLVTFADGSTQILTNSVSAVLGPDNLAQNLVASSVSGADTPTFSWSPPATPPALTPFTYDVQNLGQNGIEVPSNVTSVNLKTSGVTLKPGTYYWQVQVQDAAGNKAQAVASTPYVAP